jgi:hypothetical protein
MWGNIALIRLTSVGCASSPPALKIVLKYLDVSKTLHLPIALGLHAISGTVSWYVGEWGMSAYPRNVAVRCALVISLEIAAGTSRLTNHYHNLFAACTET